MVHFQRDVELGAEGFIVLLILVAFVLISVAAKLVESFR